MTLAKKDLKLPRAVCEQTQQHTLTVTTMDQFLQQKLQVQKQIECASLFLSLCLMGDSLKHKKNMLSQPLSSRPRVKFAPVVQATSRKQSTSNRGQELLHPTSQSKPPLSTLINLFSLTDRLKKTLEFLTASFSPICSQALVAPNLSTIKILCLTKVPPLSKQGYSLV